ncbi:MULTISPECIES: anti-sigma factor [unclassified Chelatococcus]|uniref:anti-sigma factor family protein n=1 Tax=unclassified Chelatococcus TaxID=2638111 RepID=UPI001BCDFF5B|nr:MULTISPECIES: anti-sigma factor [unclassified Chelatococcus]CAH1649872.1 Anti-sigma factor RsiW [Hyphomicrobiales bacterium]MBS7739660.1 anti-sigma factor [Chelatococcus sp. HY11]MBX3544029.1 anti-sigma factor [Chelatococcus sp.]MCO5075803.1 anti-sigma factor [Chelatococcus sp.]CAH1666866.1 Anti-sigma factor RsiW [Hyphomicrobiales bacterium]
MIRPIDPVTTYDLNAYVDGQLDMHRRIEVEDHLARHPETAARVMADMRTRDELRLAFAEHSSLARPQTTETARRLERGLARARALSRLRRFATAAVIAAAGWIAHAEVTGSSSTAAPIPAAFVDDAVKAHRIEAARMAMAAAPPTATYDPAAIRASTALAMPILPAGWRVLDIQILPAAAGSSVEIVFDAEDLGRVSLFAARADSFAVVAPATAQRNTETVAYWQMGDMAYALTGPADRELVAAARTLANALY